MLFRQELNAGAQDQQFRRLGEFFRQPDSQIGFLMAGTTMGQWLSLPMVLAGAWLLLVARRRAAAAGRGGQPKTINGAGRRA